MMDLLEPSGEALIIIASPKGRLHDLREPINPNYQHAGFLRPILDELNISYSREILEIELPEPDRETFKGLIMVYVLAACYTSDELEVLPEAQREKISLIVDGFTSASYDHKKNAYIMSEVCEYITIQKYEHRFTKPE
jgi:hypothetical protein